MKSAPISPPEGKLLLICRHAKSSWQDHTLGDVDRPLNKRGQRDAPEMGRRLHQRGLHLELIIASHAVRARTTAGLYAEQLGYPQELVRIEPALYAATTRALLTLLQQLDSGLVQVMIVGHNPEFTALANLLGSNVAIDNLPTGGVVALEFAVASWAELAPGAGQLLFFDFPKHVD